MKVRNEFGECMSFQAGQKAWIDVELQALAPCSKISVTLYMVSGNFVHVFDTSTDRLGFSAIDMEPGDVYRCTFELDLNLAEGTFYPSVVLYRYDIQAVYDRWEPAATIYLGSESGVRGIAQCFPRVTHQELRKPGEGDPIGTLGGAAGNTIPSNRSAKVPGTIRILSLRNAFKD